MAQLDQFKRRESWLELAPGLHIADGLEIAALHPFAANPAQLVDLNHSLKEEGYFQLRHNFGVDLALMAQTVRRLSAMNIPPVFGFLFDEFWAPFHALDSVYNGLLGAYGMLPHFWVWNVDPAKGDAGWTPHRDKGYASLRPDGSPIALNTWIPLSRATPLNGCIYLVPANRDPTYGTPRDQEWKFELPAIRALPAEPGDFFIWNQAVLHWGSRTSPREPETRVSMAFEFQCMDEPPYGTPIIQPNTPVPFEARLWLVAKQVLQYRKRYRVAPAIEEMLTSFIESEKLNFPGGA